MQSEPTFLSLWEEWLRTPFPSGDSVEFALASELNLPLIDFYVASFIRRYVASKDSINDKHKEAIIYYQDRLRTIITLLKGETKDYFERLYSLLQMVLYDLERDSRADAK